MNNNSVHQLIDRWLNGTSTTSEQEQLQQYFLQYGMPEEQLTDDPQYHPAADQSARMYTWLTGQLALQAPVKKVHPLNSKWLLRIAAAVIPLIMIITGAYFWQQGADNDNPTAAMKHIRNNGDGLYQVQLTDGSTVWLNKNTSLELDTVSFTQQRHIILNGEAYFDIAPDPAHPFIVAAGGLTTEVLGTTFNIKQDTIAAQTTVTLFTGKVALTVSGASPQVLDPAHAAIYDAHSGQLTTTPMSAYTLAWKTKEILCRNESFKDIIDYLQTYYSVVITSNKSIDSKHFSGTLSLQGDVSAVLNRLLFVHGLHCKKSGDNSIIIY